MLKIFKKLAELLSLSDWIETLESGTDQINRPVKLLKQWDNFFVEVDGVAIQCNSYEDAIEEYQYRINDGNRNL